MPFSPLQRRCAMPRFRGLCEPPWLRGRICSIVAPSPVRASKRSGPPQIRHLPTQSVPWRLKVESVSAMRFKWSAVDILLPLATPGHTYTVRLVLHAQNAIALLEGHDVSSAHQLHLVVVQLWQDARGDVALVVAAGARLRGGLQRGEGELAEALARVEAHHIRDVVVAHGNDQIALVPGVYNAAQVHREALAIDRRARVHVPDEMRRHSNHLQGGDQQALTRKDVEYLAWLQLHAVEVLGAACKMV